MNWEKMVILWLLKIARETLEIVLMSAFLATFLPLVAFVMFGNILFISLAALFFAVWAMIEYYRDSIHDYISMVEFSYLSFEELKQKIDDYFMDATYARNPEERDRCMHMRLLAWRAVQRKLQQ